VHAAREMSAGERNENTICIVGSPGGYDALRALIVCKLVVATNACMKQFLKYKQKKQKTNEK